MTYLSMAYLLPDVVCALARGKVWWDFTRAHFGHSVFCAACSESAIVETNEGKYP